MLPSEHPSTEALQIELLGYGFKMACPKLVVYMWSPEHVDLCYPLLPTIFSLGEMSSNSHSTLSARHLSLDDALDLTLMGRDIMQNVVGLIVESILCSAYGICFAVAVYSIFRKGIRSRGSIIMLLVVVYLYLSSVTQWALDVSAAFTNIHGFLMVPNVLIPDRGFLADKLIMKFEPAQEALWMLNMVVGDSVVIWRTWAMHQGRILAIVLPCTLLLASLVFCLIDITCFATDGPLPGAAVICPLASRTAWAFSVATNIVCTVTIGFKAWEHRKMTRELNLPGKSRGLSAQNILTLLVESGFIYSFLLLSQVIAYIHLLRSSPAMYLWNVLEPMGNQITGMYPTLIIVIVNFRRTIWDQSLGTISTGPVFHSSSTTKRSGPTETLGGITSHLERTSRENPRASSYDKDSSSESV
ncbi:hypothetical protein K438DRAFT_1970763 [Mycena galopus ATCC 62051]|nr:hypothetical protein K438DRAFT_1970763 [Mycena galopus ATCC 62051]